MITVELIVDIQPWELTINKIPKNKIVKIKVDYGETDLRTKVKSLGGKWNKIEKVWELRYDLVQKLELTERIVSG